MIQLSINQCRLQQLQVLSALILIPTPRVYRLNDSVPFKVKPQPQPVAKPAVQPTPTTSAKRPREEDEGEEVEDPLEQLIEVIETRTVAASEKRAWSNEECAMISLERSLTHREVYSLYLKECRKKNMKSRTFFAFKRKRQRELEVM